MQKDKACFESLHSLLSGTRLLYGEANLKRESGILQWLF
jgi:hypothetical protein